jgi:stage III sporulation protein AB
MLKIIGAVLIIGISTLAGFFFSQKFSERCHLLKLWLRILEIFQTEIYFQARLLPDVFRRTALSLDDRYFANAFTWLAASLEFGSDEDFGESWRRFLVETGLGILSKNDYLTLNELGNYLGCTDRNDQLAKIKTCRASLEMNLQSAEMEQSKRTGIYRYLGFAMGAIIVLWLI